MSKAEAAGFDKTTRRLTKFATGLRFEDVPAAVIHHAKRHLLDTLGCAAGGVDGAPCRIARDMARGVSGPRRARVLGMAGHTTPEHAAFANGVMLRYLDFNDGGGLAHPSDVTGGILAVAEAAGASGRQTLLGLIAAYEAVVGIGAGVPFMKLGWDQGAQIGLGVAVGAGVILGFNEDQLGNAISMTVTPSMPLRVTRSGELAMWKAVATAAAGRGAVFATYLAAAGMTGPGQPFDGRHGLRDVVSKGDWQVEINPASNDWQIAKSAIKGYPMANNTHPPTHTIIEMTRGLDLSEIESIQVRTFDLLHFESGAEPEKWDPHSRETADHSLPYVMAIGMRDGTITLTSFSPENVSAPDLRPLMNKITVVEDPQFTQARLAGKPHQSELEITMKNGEKKIARTGIVRGHHLNPMTDDELAAKFRGLAEMVSTPARVNTALAALWAIDAAANVSAALDPWYALVDPRD